MIFNALRYDFPNLSSLVQTAGDRFGLQEMDNPHAPLVFEKGIRQTNMLEALDSSLVRWVTFTALQSTREY